MTALVVVLIIIAVLAVAFGFSLLFGWLTMLVLHGFGFTQVTFWPCAGAWFLLSALFSAARSSGSSDKK